MRSDAIVRLFLKRRSHPRGVTLVELLVSIAIFLLFSLAMAEVAITLARLAARSSSRVAATAVANEIVEDIRNLPYSDVGTVGGLPPGVVPQTQTIVRNNNSFTVTTTIRSIDDPFDGTISGNPPPVDTAPADYKEADVRVACNTCPLAPIIRLVTIVAPKGLEIGTGNGALFVSVIDANGQPVPGATIHITNPSALPPIDLTDTGDANGQLQLVDVPPAVHSYHIAVSKTGYSSDTTLPATPSNPNPTKQDWTVVAGDVAKVFLSIDKLSTLNILTMNTICTPIAGVPLHVVGSKHIGEAPPSVIYKYDQNLSTDGVGRLNQTMEWDGNGYSLTVTDPTRSLVGTVGTLPVILNPNSSQSVSLILGSPSVNGLHVTVKDATTLLPISDATVDLTRPPSFEEMALTGRGYLRQTDWSGGSGQADFVDETRYQSDDGNADALSKPGQVALAQDGGKYRASAVLTSSSFDTGGPTNFTNIIWSPVSQIQSVGDDSVRWQIATNSDDTTWTYLGPDGTSNTYYTVSNQSINTIHNGARYLRYRLYLQTADAAATPIISDIAVSFTSGCIPPGQAFFSGLDDGDYTVAVAASGYDTTSVPVTVSGWTNLEVTLAPQ